VHKRTKEKPRHHRGGRARNRIFQNAEKTESRSRYAGARGEGRNHVNGGSEAKKLEFWGGRLTGERRKRLQLKGRKCYKAGGVLEKASRGGLGGRLYFLVRRGADELSGGGSGGGTAGGPYRCKWSGKNEKMKGVFEVSQKGSGPDFSV